jgi:2-amino-4-hydroxy-6-hydroxymethyldihydropteridine diphosphokinase
LPAAVLACYGAAVITGYLGLGSNLDDPPHRLLSAIYDLEINAQFDVVRASWLYESAPWGYTSPHNFCNQVIEFRWRGLLGELWGHTMQVEANLGRVHPARKPNGGEDTQPVYRDRTIDIDLLDVSGASAIELQVSTLELPHPKAHQRGFVLVPWAELEPDYILNGQPLTDWLARLPTHEVDSIRRLKEDELPHQFMAHLSRSGR